MNGVDKLSSQIATELVREREGASKFLGCTWEKMNCCPLASTNVRVPFVNCLGCGHTGGKLEGGGGCGLVLARYRSTSLFGMAARVQLAVLSTPCG